MKHINFDFEVVNDSCAVTRNLNLALESLDHLATELTCPFAVENYANEGIVDTVKGALKKAYEWLRDKMRVVGKKLKDFISDYGHVFKGARLNINQMANSVRLKAMSQDQSPEVKSASASVLVGYFYNDLMSMVNKYKFNDSFYNINQIYSEMAKISDELDSAWNAAGTDSEERYLTRLEEKTQELVRIASREHSPSVQNAERSMIASLNFKIDVINKLSIRSEELANECDKLARSNDDNGVSSNTIIRIGTCATIINLNVLNVVKTYSLLNAIVERCLTEEGGGVIKFIALAKGEL